MNTATGPDAVNGSPAWIVVTYRAKALGCDSCGRVRMFPAIMWPPMRRTTPSLAQQRKGISNPLVVVICTLFSTQVVSHSRRIERPAKYQQSARRHLPPRSLLKDWARDCTSSKSERGQEMNMMPTRQAFPLTEALGSFWC